MSYDVSDLLVNSIGDYDETGPIVLTKSGTLVHGHATLEARANLTGITTIDEADVTVLDHELVRVDVVTTVSVLKRVPTYLEWVTEDDGEEPVDGADNWYAVRAQQHIDNGEWTPAFEDDGSFQGWHRNDQVTA